MNEGFTIKELADNYAVAYSDFVLSGALDNEECIAREKALHEAISTFTQMNTRDKINLQLDVVLLWVALDALLFVAAKTECKHEAQAMLLQEAMDIAVDALKHSGGVTNEILR